MGQLTAGFAVPLYWDQHPEPAAMNAALTELFHQKMTQPEFTNPNPYTVRNDALYESRFDLFSWPEPVIRQLSDFCCSRVMQCVAEINGYDQATLKRIQLGADSWFHVTKDGGYFAIHNHPMASWSGVYCVSDGEPDPGIKNNAQLTFINPFIQSTMFVDAGNAQMKQPFSHVSQGFQLKAGQLVLFPSWLLHEVKAYFGQGERITVAFNCWFHMRP